MTGDRRGTIDISSSSSVSLSSSPSASELLVMSGVILGADGDGSFATSEAGAGDAEAAGLTGVLLRFSGDG